MPAYLEFFNIKIYLCLWLEPLFLGIFLIVKYYNGFWLESLIAVVQDCEGYLSYLAPVLAFYFVLYAVKRKRYVVLRAYNAFRAELEFFRLFWLFSNRSFIYCCFRLLHAKILFRLRNI